MKVTVQVGAEEKEIAVQRQGDDLRLVIDGRETIVHLVHQNGPHFVLEYADDRGPNTLRRRLRAAGHAEGDQRQIWVNGSLVHYRRLREQATATPAASGSLSSSIPAVVAEILVRPGDDVIAGQKLILLESMKMVIPIQAPYDGTVSGVNCTAGEAVQPGNPLVEIEAHE